METETNLNNRGAARLIVIFAATVISLIAFALTISTSAASAQDFDLQLCTQNCSPDPDPVPVPPVFAPPPTPVPIPTLPPVFMPPPPPVPTLPPVLVNPPAPDPNVTVNIFHSCEAGGVVVAYTNTGGAGGFGVTVEHDDQIPFLAHVLAPAGADETFFIELDEGATVTVSALGQSGTFTADCEPDLPEAELPEVQVPEVEVPVEAADPGNELADAGNELADPIEEFDAKQDGSDDAPAVGEESAAGPIGTVDGPDPLLLVLGGAIAALLLILVTGLLAQAGNQAKAN